MCHFLPLIAFTHACVHCSFVFIDKQPLCTRIDIGSYPAAQWGHHIIKGCSSFTGALTTKWGQPASFGDLVWVTDARTGYTVILYWCNRIQHFLVLKADDKYGKSTTSCPLRSDADFQKLRGCPSISLNFTDYKTLVQSTNQTSQMKRSSGTITTDICAVQVCFEFYLPVMPNENNGIPCTLMETDFKLVVLVMISSVLLND